MIKLMPIGKTSTFDKTFIYFKINLKFYFLTRHFDYLIDLIFD